MNAILPAIQELESTHPTSSPETSGRLFIDLPPEEELRRLSLGDRIALRLALRVLRRARITRVGSARRERPGVAERIRAEHEHQRIRTWHPPQML